MKSLYFTNKKVCKYTVSGFTFHYIPMKADHNHLVPYFLMSSKSHKCNFRYEVSAGHWQYSLSNKIDSEKKKQLVLDSDWECVLHAKWKALGSQMPSSLDECVPSPSPPPSPDVIKLKNRMESLSHLLHSAGIIRRNNKLGGLIQLS